uniref:Putative secreted protein n=1 Tax=Anopheles darlingi TaxID=43151 RepID=A0A2M4D685_ANODA
MQESRKRRKLLIWLKMAPPTVVLVLFIEQAQSFCGTSHLPSQRPKWRQCAVVITDSFELPSQIRYWKDVGSVVAGSRLSVR